MDNSFVDPTTLSLPSPSDSTSSKRAASSSPDSNAEGSSRKRQRSDGASEERKEARMHRNRIAAQNSRDRRKAQFTFLERRVAELEEENRQLRAGLCVQGMTPMMGNVMAEQEKERARDRENEELKERIKTLEKGWEAVIKALASQGLPTGLPFTPSTPVSNPKTSTSALPVIASSSPVYPLSPALSHTSALSSPGTLYADGSDFTRHPARVASIDPTSMPLQRVKCSPTSKTVFSRLRRNPSPQTQPHRPPSMKQIWTPYSARSSQTLLRHLHPLMYRQRSSNSRSPHTHPRHRPRPRRR
ncbi:hypothetical protein OE88DRAFT_1255231 [Heliocybe sulcata]|uniref:X-box-binding protein 1 n=1 Tax=Heliocybe sulcata TaxID=5364 RepID=A0A5C3N861_9AGAM|nr:hypothetical protein OE88DRAFT_1255231 [Heliocybe sulcata]